MQNIDELRTFFHHVCETTTSIITAIRIKWRILSEEIIKNNEMEEKGKRDLEALYKMTENALVLKDIEAVNSRILHLRNEHSDTMLIREREMCHLLERFNEVSNEWSEATVQLDEIFIYYYEKMENGETELLRDAGDDNNAFENIQSKYSSISLLREKVRHSTITNIQELFPLVLALAVGPVPTPLSQAFAAETLATMISRTPYWNSKDWDTLFHDHCLLGGIDEALSTAVPRASVSSADEDVYTYSSYSYPVSSSPSDPKMIEKQAQHGLIKLLFVSVAASGQLAMEFLCSNDYVNRFVSFLRDSVRQMRRPLESLIHQYNTLELELCCYGIYIVQILTTFGDAAVVLISHGIDQILIEVLDIDDNNPHSGNESENRVLSCNERKSSVKKSSTYSDTLYEVSGLPTAKTIALQALITLSNSSAFDRLFQQWRLQERIQHIICVKIIRNSQWRELIERGCQWLEICFERLGATPLCVSSSKSEIEVSQIKQPRKLMKRATHLKYKNSVAKTSTSNEFAPVSYSPSSGSGTETSCEKHNGYTTDEDASQEPDGERFKRQFFESVILDFDLMNSLVRLLDIARLTQVRHKEGNINNGRNTLATIESAQRCALASAKCIHAAILYCPWNVRLPEYLVRRTHFIRFAVAIMNSHMSFRAESPQGASVPPSKDTPLISIIQIYLTQIISFCCCFGSRTRNAVASSIQKSLSCRSQAVLWLNLEISLARCPCDINPGANNTSIFLDWNIMDSTGNTFNNIREVVGDDHVIQEGPSPSTTSDRTTVLNAKSANHINCAVSKNNVYCSSTKNETLNPDQRKCLNLEILFRKQEEREGIKTTIMKRRKILSPTKDSDVDPIVVKEPRVTRNIMYLAIQKTMQIAANKTNVVSNQHPGSVNFESYFTSLATEKKINESIALSPKHSTLLIGRHRREHNSNLFNRNADPASLLHSSMMLVSELAQNYVGNIKKIEKDQERTVSSALLSCASSIGNGESKRDGYCSSYASRISSSLGSTVQKSEIIVPTSQARIVSKIVKPVQHLTRTWSVRDIQESDLCYFIIPMRNMSLCDFKTKENIHLTGSINFDGYSLVHLILMFQNAEKLVSDHLLHLHTTMEKCPIAWYKRRCLLNDIYNNVYPKVLFMIHYIWQCLNDHGDSAGRKIFVFVMEEKMMDSVDASNLTAVYHHLGGIYL